MSKRRTHCHKRTSKSGQSRSEVKTAKQRASKHCHPNRQSIHNQRILASDMNCQKIHVPLVRKVQRLINPAAMVPLAEVNWGRCYCDTAIQEAIIAVANLREFCTPKSLACNFPCVLQNSDVMIEIDLAYYALSALVLSRSAYRTYLTAVHMCGQNICSHKHSTTNYAQIAIDYMDECRSLLAYAMYALNLSKEGLDLFLRTDIYRASHLCRDLTCKQCKSYRKYGTESKLTVSILMYCIMRIVDIARTHTCQSTLFYKPNRH